MRRSLDPHRPIDCQNICDGNGNLLFQILRHADGAISIRSRTARTSAKVAETIEKIMAAAR